MKQDFKTASLGIPDLAQGNWLIQDVAGHGMLKGIGAVEPQMDATLNAAPVAPPLARS